MAKTLEQMRAKWERKTQNAGAKWQDRTRGAGGRLSEGLRALGVSPGPQFMAAWESGVGAVSATDFQQSISGKGEKLIRNFVDGVSR